MSDAEIVAEAMKSLSEITARQARMYGIEWTPADVVELIQDGFKRAVRENAYELFKRALDKTDGVS